MYQSLHTVIRLDDRLKRHFTKRGRKLVAGYAAAGASTAIWDDRVTETYT